MRLVAGCRHMETCAHLLAFVLGTGPSADPVTSSLVEQGSSILSYVIGMARCSLRPRCTAYGKQQHMADPVVSSHLIHKASVSNLVGCGYICKGFFPFALRCHYYWCHDSAQAKSPNHFLGTEKPIYETAVPWSYFLIYSILPHISQNPYQSLAPACSYCLYPK